MPVTSDLYPFAYRAYKGVTDKGGEPLFYHACRVRWRVIGTLSLDLVQAALLHDVLEDTELGPEDLLAAGASPKAVELVQAVSRAPDEVYADFIERVARHSPEASAVKLADVYDHLDPNNGIPLPESLRKRYEREVEKLKEAAGAYAPLITKRLFLT